MDKISLSLEEELTNLEEMLLQIESEDTSIDMAITLYEKAINNSKKIDTFLQTTAEKISVFNDEANALIETVIESN